MENFISAFLALNASPSDAQVHALATALGVDKESLEAEMYKLLGTQLHADAEEVLEGDEDVATTPVDDLTLNDGDPTDDDVGLQEETDDDGIDVQDKGIGMSIGDEDVLTDDGIPDLSFE